jgi:hypothetical protein
MSTKRKAIESVSLGSLTIASMGLLLAAGCIPDPIPVPGKDILVSKSLNSVSQGGFPPADFGGCLTADGGEWERFVAPEKGKHVTITVIGPVSASRPQILVVDEGLIPLVNPVPATSNVATASFTSRGSESLIWAFNECSGFFPGAYLVEITAE